MKVLAFLTFIFLSYAVVSQTLEIQDAEAPKKPLIFSILPIIETAFSGELSWRPDWPLDIPPDAFFPIGKNKEPGTLELYNVSVNYKVKRDDNNRLVEYPFFLPDECVKIEMAYASNGALLNMIISFDEKETTETDDESQNENKKTFNVKFPENFMPYTDLSPGGSFPPVEISSGDDIFYVFFFESPAFLTETWYDSEGVFLSFNKALVNRDNSAWRIWSLQMHNAGDTLIDDYYFDSSGNVTEIRRQDRRFSAVYGNGLPRFWQCPDFRSELQWDTQGFLTAVKTTGETTDANIDYTYEYKRDEAGGWSERQETAFVSRFDLSIPEPTYSRGIWYRKIELLPEIAEKPPED
ncbi:MAG: hypothetical protein LBH44_13765 [Treponema sp.]|jgi:hypothetical protein|nr:hypothetical protein [Treponema sp.]